MRTIVNAIPVLTPPRTWLVKCSAPFCKGSKPSEHLHEDISKLICLTYLTKDEGL